MTYFLCVNDNNLHPVMHRFQDVAGYWSNFCCRQGVPLFNALSRGEPLNSELQNFASTNYRRRSVVCCKLQSLFRYLEPILGVDHEYDDIRTYRLSYRRCRD